MKHESANKNTLPNLNYDIERAKFDQNSKIEKLQLNSPTLKGYVQEISQDPFGYILTSKVQVR